MMAMPVVERMTAEAYLARPYDPRRRGEELIGGELVMHEALLRHQLACGEIHIALVLWTRAQPGRGLATMPIDVLIGEYDVYGPDVLWYGEGRAPERRSGRPYPVPDLAVEVRSPSTWRYDIGAKKAGYERSGLPELWLVDTAADVVLVFRRSRPDAPVFDVALELMRGDDVTSPSLPGFALALDVIFG